MLEVEAIDRSPEGLREVAAYLAEVWPNARHLTPRYLDWQYNQNPDGPVFGFNARSADGRLVGHFAYLPVRVWLLGEREPGLIIFNLSTHPDARGRGALSLLRERAEQEALARGIRFYYGVTNAMSTPIYERYGGQPVAGLEVKLGVGPVPARSGEGAREFQRIWSADALAWRVRDPRAEIHARRRGAESEIFSPTGRFGIWAHLGTFPSADLPADLPLLRAANPLRLWMGIDASRVWSRGAYLGLPRRLRPSPLVIMFFDLSGERRRLDAGRVRFDAIDFDAF